MKEIGKYLLVFILIITIGIFGGCGGGGGGDGNDGDGGNKGINYFSFKEIAGKWDITEASGYYNSVEGNYFVSIKDNTKNEKSVAYINENRDMSGNFEIKYYYEIDISSGDKSLPTMTIDKTTPGRVMILRVNNNTFRYTYDRSVITIKCIDKNKQEVNEMASLNINGSPVVLNIDLTLIRK